MPSRRIAVPKFAQLAFGFEVCIYEPVDVAPAFAPRFYHTDRHNYAEDT